MYYFYLLKLKGKEIQSKFWYLAFEEAFILNGPFLFPFIFHLLLVLHLVLNSIHHCLFD